MMKPITAIVATLLLAGCVSTGKSPAPLTAPEGWIAPADDTANIVETDDLQGWWKDFNDPLLDTLVQHALVDNPDRLMAQARIAEARGLRREARGGLFPQIDLSGSVGREDQGLSTPTYPDNFYDAAFDASYEIDLFGRNRNAAKAANERFLAAEQQYHNTGLSLVAEVVRTYIAYRQAQNRLGIANKNLVSQEETLKLIDDLYRLGVAPKLDVERANNLVNTTRASIPEFQRQADTARFQIAVLLGVFPDALPEDLQSRGDIPGANARPVLMAPAQILANRPDVKAAMHVLAANTALSNAAAAEVFPTLTLSGFYGIRDNGLVSAVNPW
ncbi:MAG: efflux transporter outer membrane subunit, partial [Bdellovibrionales bacterium]